MNVLLVEDNAGDARLIRELLGNVSSDAFEVKCASCLSEGLACVRPDTDIVLLDLGLPDSQGIATFSNFHSRLPDVPVIVLTGLIDEAAAVATVREGAQDYLVKGQSDGTLLARSIRYAIERQRAQKEGERARERITWLTKAVEQSPASVLITDTGGTIEYVNDRFTEITGYSRAEAVGRTPAILHSGRTPATVYQDLWATIANGGEWRGELLNRRSDGELYWDEALISPIRNAAGAITHYLAVQQDITRRKTAEAEIKSLNENLEHRVLERTRQLETANTELIARRRELQDYVDAMSTFNAKLSLDATILLINRTAEQALGIDAGALLRTNFLEGRWWFDGAVMARVRDAFARAREGTPVSCEEQALISEKVLTIGFSLVPVRNADGEVIYVVAEGRDITRRLEAEQALKAANHELEAFTYSVSHDLRAPIRHVDGFSRLLSEHVGSTLDAKAQHYLHRIRDATQHMGQLVDDLLHLAHIGRQDLRPRAAPLNTLVEEVLSSMQADLAGRDIRWNIECLPTVHCDAGLMKVVFTNLLSNAVKYTRPRGRAQIEIGHTMRHGRPVIHVRDNGVGFDMQYADKLFGVFQRLHRVEDFEGTGVGLATVQRIVRKHGGEIWAESEPDKGATFYFTVTHLSNPVPLNGIRP